MMSNTDTSPADYVAIERERIRSEYRRRAREVCPDLYAAAEPFARFAVEGRNRKTAEMLKAVNVFPKSGDKCLEVGFGNGGWFSQLLAWGVEESDLHGIELDPARAAQGRELFPAADLRTGDAVELPWESGAFRIVIASTVFTSILDDRVRRLVADEIVRVMSPDGAFIWYDFAYNNPRNANVRGVTRRQIRSLFPALQGKIQSITLAPPLGRFIVPRSSELAKTLEAIPVLRTHLLAVLTRS